MCEDVREIAVSCRNPAGGRCALLVFRAEAPCVGITPVVFVRLKVSLRFLYKGTKRFIKNKKKDNLLNIFNLILNEIGINVLSGFFDIWNRI